LIFDFPKCLAFIDEKGKELFSRQFRIWDEDRQLIYKLLVCFIRDRENATRLGLNPGKGILLTGPVGCGKTCLMKLMHLFQSQSERFMLKSCREISFEFIKSGYEVIQKYGSASGRYASRSEKPPATYCFDDLGTEQNLKYYGNECNVMGEILLSRYELFVSGGTLTHLTTNLSASEIESFYGNRVRSRMREMFNLISFPKDTKDKRK